MRSSPARRTARSPRSPSATLRVRAEIRFPRPADGAVPVVGDVAERGAGRDAAVGVAFGGVVDEAARLADPQLGGSGGAHPRQPSIGRRMDVEGPAPGEELNCGAPTTPRQAASVIVLHGGGASLEVLLLRRNPAARFMGGAWVFPGGAVDECDVAEGERDEGASRRAGETDLSSHRMAAVREV